MKQCKVKKFAGEAEKLNVTDLSLSETLSHFLNIDPKSRQKSASGAGSYRLRIATNEGQAKSAGSRTLLAFKNENRIIWLHLFAKNDKENITLSELKKLKLLANILLSMSGRVNASKNKQK